MNFLNLSESAPAETEGRAAGGSYFMIMNSNIRLLGS